MEEEEEKEEEEQQQKRKEKTRKAENRRKTFLTLSLFPREGSKDKRAHGGARIHRTRHQDPLVPAINWGRDRRSGTYPRSSAWENSRIKRSLKIGGTNSSNQKCKGVAIIRAGVTRTPGSSSSTKQSDGEPNPRGNARALADSFMYSGSQEDLGKSQEVCSRSKDHLIRTLFVLLTVDCCYA